jgi:hypothetical protein
MSIPLTTMLKLRGFSPDDFAALDPNQVQMKVVMPVPLEPEPEKTRLELVFFSDDQDVKKYTFPMELVGVEEEVRGWRRKTTWRYFTLQITPEGKQDFVKLQHEIDDNMKTRKHGQLAAWAPFKEVPEGQMPEKATLSILLQLNKQDGFFTLIDEAEIDFREMKKTE